MTLTCLSGAKSLRDPLASQLLGEWVASSPLAKAWWYEATEVAQLPLIRNKRIQTVKQSVCVLFPAPELIGLLMDLNVPRDGFRHVSEVMTRRKAAYTAATGLPFPRPIPSRDRFMDTMEGVGQAACARSACVRGGYPHKRMLLAVAIVGRLHPIASTPCGPH